MITCSRNEVEAHARRAARGAGLSWGLAEEAGKAARWLATRGLPGVEVLARVLTCNDGVDYARLAPQMSGAEWRAEGGALCPLCAGAAISDRAGLLDHGVTLRDVSFPLLLAPFAHRAALASGCDYELRWQGVRLKTGADGFTLLEGDTVTLAVASAVAARIEVGLPATPGEVGGECRRVFAPHDASVSIPLDAWRTLEELAGRTYVPATAESRERGAGEDR